LGPDDRKSADAGGGIFILDGLQLKGLDIVVAQFDYDMQASNVSANEQDN
jgi:hypothetical protein